MVPKWNLEFTWTHSIPSREDWNLRNSNVPISPQNTWFTDGSRMDGLSGAGVFCENPEHKSSMHMGRYATVFQAEVFAILSCSQLLLGEAASGLQISICSDSQAAIQALTAYKCSSRLVQECIDSLNTLGLCNEVKLLWVPGHCGIEGNEEADQLARLGSSSTPITPEPVVGMARCIVKTALKESMFRELNNLWRNSAGMRQSKLMIKGPSKKLTRSLLDLNRSTCHTVTGTLTGHCRLNRHLHIMGLSTSPMCRLCEEEEETPSHILSSCPALTYLRWQIFGLTIVPIEELVNLSLKKIVTFCDSVSLFRG
jgi:ribonuclease HI